MTSKLKERSINQGNLMGVTAQTHRLGPYLTMTDDYRGISCAKEEHRLLQGQLWRQKLEFREVRQQSLTEMEESL